jgi:hypothetical protein
MKHVIASAIFAVGLLAAAFAQTPPPPAPPPLEIKGNMTIDYRTRDRRTGESTVKGTTDVYTLNITAAKSAVFAGTIEQRSYMQILTGSNQLGFVKYDMETSVIHPQTGKVLPNGKIVGQASITSNNVYTYGDGTRQDSVKMIVFPMGRANGFESPFTGNAVGKPPAKSSLSKLKQDTVTLFSRKGGKILLTKYDKMTLENHVIPAGPAQAYPATTVSGTLFYDYNREAWHFNNVTFSYSATSAQGVTERKVDTLTGSIRWIALKNRLQTGVGHYNFDIRVNEPPPSEAAQFAAPSDESAFFDTDDFVPGLSGAMNYKDTFAPNTDKPLRSAVEIDLKSNKLTKQQVVMLTKLIMLSFIVPLNAE